MKNFALSMFARNVRLSAAARTITGTITSYDTPSTSQHIVIEQGALTARQPLDRVKLLRDHNQSDPVGYMTSLDDTATEATFFVPEGDNGDLALTEAQNGLRDGLSIGFSITEYAFDDSLNLHVYAAELYEVSLCAIPDMQDARVTDVAATLSAITQEVVPTMNRAQLAAALAAGTITQATHDAKLAELETAELATKKDAPKDEPTVDVPAELKVGPKDEKTAQPVVVRDRSLSLREVTERVSLAAATGDPMQVRLALVDVVPADDAGKAFIQRQDWIGELFTARAVSRPWIDSFGVPAQLNSLKTTGYQITNRPKPEAYAGNKTDVGGTGKLTTAPKEFAAVRWAGGWDIDRAFIDLGDASYLAAFWAAAVEEYQAVSDSYIATQAIAAAHANTAASPDVFSAILSIAATIRRIKGAQLNRIKLSDDLFDEYAMLKADEVPFWLRNAATASPDLTNGTFDVNQLSIVADGELAPGTVQGFDSRGAVVREKSPIQVQAVDVARGGIDLGFYSYGLFELHDPRVFVERTVAAE